MFILITYPSVHPVAKPSFIIPIIVDTNAANNNIRSIVSSKHSIINSHNVVGSFSTGVLSPKLSLFFYTSTSVPSPYYKYRSFIILLYLSLTYEPNQNRPQMILPYSYFGHH